MLEAMVAGERDPEVLAQMALGAMRRKIPLLNQALAGYFTDHHAFVVATLLQGIDDADTLLERLGTEIDRHLAPFRRQVELLCTIPGVQSTLAAVLIAEIGVDMSRFPTAAHLVSWAKFCPQTHESAGKRRNKGRAKGNPWLAATLGNVVAVLASSDTFLGARYRRLARRRGKQKAIVAVGNSLLTHIWHLLSDPQRHYVDLGVDHYQAKINKERRARDLARALQAVTGQTILVRDGKISIADPAA
jgi:transposase